MTVLQRNTATGLNLRGFGKIFGSAVLVAAIAAGVTVAVNSIDNGEQAAATMTAERAAELNALNRADGIGIPGPRAVDKADLVLSQVGAAKALAAAQQRAADMVNHYSAGFGSGEAAGVDLADRIDGYPAPESSSSSSSGSDQFNHGGWTAK